MKIACFVNSFNAINWGGQGTSEGIRHLVMKEYPTAEFCPLDLPALPLKNFRSLRNIHDRRLIRAILRGDRGGVEDSLGHLGIDMGIFEPYSHICFNGEGAIHSGSGHLARLLGILFLLQDRKVIAAINQTIDLARTPAKEKALVAVYSKLPFVSVREPVSLDYVRSAGLKNARLIPDAVYGLPKLTGEEIASITKSYDLPDKFVAVTGSSALKRNRHSLRRAARLLQAIRSITGLEIVFLANAKTDIWIADRLSGRFGFKIIKPPVRHRDASAIIASAQLMIGGRQHPNIFAFIYRVPYIPLKGNTHKNDGVAQLQKYPIAPLDWECPMHQLEDACDVANRLSMDWTLPEVRIDNYRIFG